MLLSCKLPGIRVTFATAHWHVGCSAIPRQHHAGLSLNRVSMHAWWSSRLRQQAEQATGNCRSICCIAVDSISSLSCQASAGGLSRCCALRVRSIFQMLLQHAIKATRSNQESWTGRDVPALMPQKGSNKRVSFRQKQASASCSHEIRCFLLSCPSKRGFS